MRHQVTRDYHPACAPTRRDTRKCTVISQQALTAMTMQEALTMPLAFTPHKPVPATYDTCSTNYAHFAAPMIHPTTEEIISSYKCLMNDPATAKVWQTAFGKDFGGMVQGDRKTGQKGTNSVFVIKHKEIDIAMAAGHKWTYARIVVDHQPQKEDHNQIRIAVGGNLITYKGSTWHVQPISRHLNCCGTACSARQVQSICASTLKTST
jgi:hypothetical protein